ncbi:MAG: putative lipid II flippase FtsW [Actinobacteria bacterium]|nr:putative lipid II flippase FtsW [Actinomycetota bacterium]MCL6095275.1 putative lipid II flippase FtsW [Actinomycetota bacterium]
MDAPNPHRVVITPLKGILIVVSLLCLIGLVMVLASSSVSSIALYHSPWVIFILQVVWMLLGAVLCFIGYRIDYHWWRKWRVVLPGLCLFALTVVLLPGIGVSAYGSSRWVGFGPVRIQPSEAMKLAMIIFVADLIARRAHQVHVAKKVLLPVLLLLFVASVLIMKQPDMGTTMVLWAITLALLFAGGIPMKTLVKLLGVLAVLGVLLAYSDPYRRARLLSFINPWAHASSSGYQVVQSIIGIGAGGTVGAGLGVSSDAWGFLPNAHTDFIFAVIGHEMGFIGVFVIITLFTAFGWYGLRVATRAPDTFGQLLAVGITAWILSQAVINIGATVGLMPVTGIPLPFVSYGGSSLSIVMAATGILANIAKQVERQPSLRAASLTRRPRYEKFVPTSTTVSFQ